MTKRIAALCLTALFISVAYSTAFAYDDIIKFRRDIVISKDMTVKDVFVVYGSVTSYGKVEGNLIVIGGSVYLKDAASVKDDVVVVGGSIEKGPSATVGGDTTQIDVPRFLPFAATILAGGWVAVWAIMSIMVLVGFLGLAVLAMALIPAGMRKVIEAMEVSFLKMLAWGLFWSLMMVPVAALLAISIVGIVLIPLQIVVAVLAYIVGYIASAVYIGKKIFLALKRAGSPFADAIVGMLVLFAAACVPVLGIAVKAVFLLAGFGAVVVTRFGTAK
jgi:hypothetical protein